MRIPSSCPSQFGDVRGPLSVGGVGLAVLPFYVARHIAFLGIDSLIMFIRTIHYGVRCMPKAFVFMNIDAGSENEILNSLREVPEVKESYFVYGVYDVVAKIETESMDRLKEVITWKVRRLDKIRSTLTTIVSEGK